MNLRTIERQLKKRLRQEVQRAVATQQTLELLDHLAALREAKAARRAVLKVLRETRPHA